MTPDKLTLDELREIKEKFYKQKSWGYEWCMPIAKDFERLLDYIAFQDAEIEELKDELATWHWLTTWHCLEKGQEDDA